MKLTEIFVLVIILECSGTLDGPMYHSWLSMWWLEMCYFIDIEKKKVFYKNSDVWLLYCSLGHTLLMKQAVYNEWKKISNILNILLPVNSLYKCISSN